MGTKKVWFYAALRDRIRPYPKKLFFDFFEKIFLPFFSKKIGSKKSKKVFVNFWPFEALSAPNFTKNEDIYRSHFSRSVTLIFFA